MVLKKKVKKKAIKKAAKKKPIKKVIKEKKKKALSDSEIMIELLEDIAASLHALVNIAEEQIDAAEDDEDMPKALDVPKMQSAVVAKEFGSDDSDYPEDMPV